MNIDNEFKVNLPIGQAWDVLTDLEGIAPCMPGAQLTGSEGDTYSGRVKVKVGPVTTEYAGTAAWVERDSSAYRAVISAKGREARGTGNASATITAQLRPDGDQTLVSVSTDLKISGKIAQFGSSVIAEVSEKLLGQFVDNLEAMLAARNDGHPDDPERPGTLHVVQPGPEAEAVDLMKLAGGSVAKRAVPVLIGVVAVGVVIYLITRRTCRRP